MSLNSYYTTKLPDAMYVYDTPATNIQLLTLDKKKSLVDSTYYGINGGWFNLSASGEIGRGLLNITYCDGRTRRSKRLLLKVRLTLSVSQIRSPGPRVASHCLLANGSGRIEKVYRKTRLQMLGQHWWQI